MKANWLRSFGVVNGRPRLNCQRRWRWRCCGHGERAELKWGVKWSGVWSRIQVTL